VVLVLRDGDQAADRGAELLRGQPYVRELTAAGGQVRLYVDDGGAALPHLLRVLDGARVAIRSVQLSEPTLDDVFLRKTGRRLRDTGEVPEGRAA